MHIFRTSDEKSYCSWAFRELLYIVPATNAFYAGDMLGWSCFCMHQVTMVRVWFSKRQWVLISNVSNTLPRLEPNIDNKWTVQTCRHNNTLYVSMDGAPQSQVLYILLDVSVVFMVALPWSREAKLRYGHAIWLRIVLTVFISIIQIKNTYTQTFVRTLLSYNKVQQYERTRGHLIKLRFVFLLNR